MKKTFLLLIISSLITTIVHAAPVLVDGIIAIVNNAIVLNSDVTERLSANPSYQSLDQQEKMNVWKKIRDTIIDELLVDQEAENQGIEVSETEIDRQMQTFLQQNNFTSTQLNQLLNQQGKTLLSFREDFSKRIRISRFIGQTIRPKVKISDDDINYQLVQQAGNKLLEFVQFHLRHIYNRDQTAISNAYRALQKGLKFEDAAKTFSEDQLSRSKGGDLGTVAKADLDIKLRQAVIDLKPGQYSKPIATEKGFHILQLVKINTIAHPQLEQIKQSISQKLTEEETQKQYKMWLANKRKTTSITLIKL